MATRERWYADQDHSRWVYKDCVKNRVHKVWNHTYVRRDNLVTALNDGFYDETLIPHFVGLIFHGGLCAGYVTEWCEKNNSMDDNLFEHIKQQTLETEP